MADTCIQISQITDAGLLKAVQAANTGQNIWGVVTTGILTLLGAYKQYKMYDQMGDLAEAQGESVKALQKINEDNFNKIVLPQHERAKDLFWNYHRSGWSKKIEQQVAECGLRACEYEGDQEEDIVAGLADAADVIRNAEQGLARATSPFAVGECCDNKFRIAALKATLFSNIKNGGRKWYRELKLRYDTLYWQKQLGAAQIAQNSQQLAANLLVNAGSQINGSLDGMARAVSLMDNAVQSQFSALGAQAGNIGQTVNAFNSFIGSAAGQRNSGAVRDVFTAALGMSLPGPIASRFGSFFMGGLNTGAASSFVGPPDAASPSFVGPSAE